MFTSVWEGSFPEQVLLSLLCEWDTKCDLSGRPAFSYRVDLLEPATKEKYRLSFSTGVSQTRSEDCPFRRNVSQSS